ncbi:MAG: MarR family transcriptional regulator [Turicibacter sp.]|nr:MarR family transcriptional regulator [Turicibacter sp.]
MVYLEMARDLIWKLMYLHRTGPQRLLNDYMQGEYFVLNCLQRRGCAILPGQISKEMNVTSARIAQTLNNLEKKQLITRQIDPQDRRKILVSLTENGRQEAEHSRQAILELFAAILSHLDEEDAREYVRLTGKLAEGIASMKGDEQHD